MDALPLAGGLFCFCVRRRVINQLQQLILVAATLRGRPTGCFLFPITKFIAGLELPIAGVTLSAALLAK